MRALLLGVSLQRSGHECFCIETVSFSETKNQKRSWDFEFEPGAQWGSYGYVAALDCTPWIGFFYVLPCLEDRGWTWGQFLWRCHKCGVIAPNLGLTTSRSMACTLPAEVLPHLPRASPAAAGTLRWVGSGSQTSGQLTAFLVGLLGWLFNSLNLLTAELDKCLCWRRPARRMAGPTSSSCKLACLPLRNRAFTWGRKKATKGSVFKEVHELDCILCLLWKLSEVNKLGVIEFEILALVFLLVGGFCIRTFKLNLYIIFFQFETKRSVIVHSVSTAKLASCHC